MIVTLSSSSIDDAVVHLFAYNGEGRRNAGSSVILHEILGIAIKVKFPDAKTEGALMGRTLRSLWMRGCGLAMNLLCWYR